MRPTPCLPRFRAAFARLPRCHILMAGMRAIAASAGLAEKNRLNLQGQDEWKWAGGEPGPFSPA